MVNTKIADLVQCVAELDESSRRVFVENLFGAFGEKERSRLVQWVCHCAYPKTRWSKVERWMEGQFRRDMNKTPRKTASVAVSYFRINPKMLPFLIKTAQRVKLRVRARRRLHPEEFADLREAERYSEALRWFGAFGALWRFSGSARSVFGLGAEMFLDAVQIKSSPAIEGAYRLTVQKGED